MLSSYFRLNIFVRMASRVLFEISKAICQVLTVVLDIEQRFKDLGGDCQVQEQEKLQL